ESPAEKLMELLRTAGAEVSYHDPHVASFDGDTSVALEPERYDCVVIVTAHSSIDYADVVRRGNVIVDFRNATKGAEVDGKVWKLSSRSASWVSATGARTSHATSTSSARSARSATSTSRCARASPRVTRARVCTRTTASCSRTTRSTPSSSQHPFPRTTSSRS